jgi:uncharacterized protein YdiU (UPF0061 family)
MNLMNNNMGWNFQNTYVNLSPNLFSRIRLNPVKAPKIVVLNEELVGELGLNIDGLKSEEGVSVLSGNRIPEGGLPIAQAYAGHQFGHFTMLGDGRALLLGEHITPKGKRYDIQLKGSGRTPYSRGGDGRAALGPMLREYIISEAMHKLGIPSSRSLAVVTTGEVILREQPLAGAILTRVASSHIRVGTFQYISTYESLGELKELADYTIERHFPDIIEVGDNRYLKFLKEVVKKQATLIAKWQLVGFIHGVMNTDNMAISGETIDYGPCAFMDAYNPATVFSSIDRQGRYAYGNQPMIAAWNLARFAETLLPLIHDDAYRALELANEAIVDFTHTYNDLWIDGMRRKLGIFEAESGDESIIMDLLSLMKKYRADFTNTFRALSIDDLSGMELFASEEFSQWKGRWESRLAKEGKPKAERVRQMKGNNPAIIPRNYRVEEALDAAVNKGELRVMEELLEALSNPYGYTCQQEKYAQLDPNPNRNYRTFCGT